MKRIRLYRHADCERCARLAVMHHRLDWLGRFEASTEPLPSRPVRMGEIAIQDLATGTLWRSVEGFRLLCRAIPAYWPFLPFTYLPFIRRRIEAEMAGGGKACEIPPRGGR